MAARPERLLHAIQNSSTTLSGWKGGFITIKLKLSQFLFISAQLVTLEKEVKERSRKDSQKEQQEAEAPIINPGGFGDRLLLTQGNGWVPCASCAQSPRVSYWRFSMIGQAPPMPNGMVPVSIFL